MDVLNINIYRIVHRDNVAAILQNGMFCIEHPNFDPENIFIGDSMLTDQRRYFTIPLAGFNEHLGEYIPFYFGYRSPMLLNICTGYRNVLKRPQ